ncbi:hypothetical protein MMPV_008308 [Pyropia vietnamensis]
MDGSAAAPTGELVLVLFAVILSLLLTVWVTVGEDEDHESRRISPTVYLIGVWVLAVGCLVTGFLPLGLMFVGRVSLDATATALTGLLPAVLVLVRVDGRLLYARSLMRRTPALHSEVLKFRFLRLGAVEVKDVVARSPPQLRGSPTSTRTLVTYETPSDNDPSTSVHHYYSQPPVGDSQRKCFVVCGMPKKNEKVQQSREGSTPDEFQEGNNMYWQDAEGIPVKWPRDEDASSQHPPTVAYPQEFWWGKVLRPGSYPDNVVHLTKFDRNHPPLRWWRSLTNAAHVVASPSRVYLERRHSAIVALALAVDLVVAGDLILHFFADYLRSLVNSPHFRKSLDTTAATCNRFFAEVGLATQWGPISAQSAAFGTPEGFRNCTRGERYGIVFFLLTESSGNFAVEPHSLSLGIDLVQQLSKIDRQRRDVETDRQGRDVETEVYESTYKWLSSWGARNMPERNTPDVQAASEGAAVGAAAREVTHAEARTERHAAAMAALAPALAAEAATTAAVAAQKVSALAAAMPTHVPLSVEEAERVATLAADAGAAIGRAARVAAERVATLAADAGATVQAAARDAAQGNAMEESATSAAAATVPSSAAEVASTADVAESDDAPQPPWSEVREAVITAAEALSEVKATALKSAEAMRDAAGVAPRRPGLPSAPTAQQTGAAERLPFLRRIVSVSRAGLAAWRTGDAPPRQPMGAGSDVLQVVTTVGDGGGGGRRRLSSRH